MHPRQRTNTWCVFCFLQWVREPMSELNACSAKPQVQSMSFMQLHHDTPSWCTFLRRGVFSRERGYFGVPPRRRGVWIPDVDQNFSAQSRPQPRIAVHVRQRQASVPSRCNSLWFGQAVPELDTFRLFDVLPNEARHFAVSTRRGGDKLQAGAP